MAKPKTKKSVDPSQITPEYIAEQRRLRELRKAEKRRLDEEQGVSSFDNAKPSHLSFIKRPMLEAQAATGGPKVSIMTYNMLAQALIRRKLFPTSGDALKWSTRSQVLLDEFKHYNADILCLQEVDFIQFNLYWRPEFEKLGYDSKFHRLGAKNHGVAIVFRRQFFVCSHLCHIHYDRESSNAEDRLIEVKPACITQNVGLLACLDFTPYYKSLWDILPIKTGLIVGTTHLFWHPFGTYERTRQTYIVLKKCLEFQHTLLTLNPENSYYTFFAGDFNSQPFDSPYLSMTSKPVTYKDRAETVLACSISYRYGEERQLKEGGEGAEEGVERNEGSQDDRIENAEGKKIEEHIDKNEENSPEINSKDVFATEGAEDMKDVHIQPTDPVPESFVITPEQKNLVNQMQNLHNSLLARAISLYSTGYSNVHPLNSGLDNDRNEPFFSNWAHAWRGLLDYIFVVAPWDGESDKRGVELMEQLENDQGIRILRLLRMPEAQEMGLEPSGQPRLGQYASDHLCLVAEVELK